MHGGTAMLLLHMGGRYGARLISSRTWAWRHTLTGSDYTGLHSALRWALKVARSRQRWYGEEALARRISSLSQQSLDIETLYSC